MTKEQLDRIKKAYSSGLKIQIWFNGYWKDFDIQDYSMYPEPFSENRQYRIIGSEYADIAENQIADLEATNKRISDECHNLVDSLERIQKENAELKSRDCWKGCLYASGKSELIHEILQQQYNLTKAKEIIRKLMDWYWETDICSDTMPQELRQNAEQFLKEIEK